MSNFNIEAFIEEQQVISERAEEKEKQDQSRKQKDTPPSSRSNGRDYDRADEPRPKRRELDHYDGRRGGLRTSSDRYLSEREENDQRRSRRSRDLADETDVRPGSDRDSANGAGRKTRSRSPRPGSHRSDARSYRARSRSRTISPSRRTDSYTSRSYRGSDDRRRDDRRSDRYDEYRPSGRRDDGGRRNGGRRGDTHRGSRRSPEGSRRTPDPTDEERDSRTVFVQQLANRLKNRELRKFFETAGAVIDAQIVTDRVSGRSKGVGYVEFKDEASVQTALSYTGQKLMGVPIIVALTEAEKNRQARLKETTTGRNNSAPQTRLYVGNIQFSITEQDLTELFSPWGELVAVILQKDENGRSRGYAFVEYTNPESAKEALEKMNNFPVGDRAIRVGLGGDRSSHFPEADKSTNGNNRPNGNFQGSSFSGMGGRGAHAGGTGYNDRSGGRDADKTGGASALDDVDMDNVNFNNFNRNDLMRKLARTDEPIQAVLPRTESRPAVVESPTATRCILLKNVYDQHDMTENNWLKTTQDDIFDECNSKYGKVVHIAVAPENNEGEVYIKFENTSGGEKAYQSLQGRFFGGHRITAQYVVDVVYNSLFPRAAKA